MMCLSLRQPWAHAVVHLGKTIENRRWGTTFRGDFLIHASKGMTKNEYLDAVSFCDAVLERGISNSILATGEMPQAKALPKGVIVGAARLVDVIPPCEHCVERGFDCGGEHRKWHMPEQFGFVLEKIRPAPRLVPCVGHLGFFQVPDDVVAKLRAA